MITRPFSGHWDGSSIAPSDKYSKALCARQFVVGEVHRFVVEEPRTKKEHRFFFACVNSAWKTMPEKYNNKWQNVDHFRKWLLIQARYCDAADCACTTKAEARRTAAFVAKTMSARNEYGIVTVNGTLVTVLTAKSMSLAAMKTKVFRSVKKEVLLILEEMTGVPVKTIEAEAEAETRPARAA